MKTRLATIVIAAALLAGCESFNLGSFAYIAKGDGGTFTVFPPAAAASAAQ
jgi:hypothetical protein